MNRMYQVKKFLTKEEFAALAERTGLSDEILRQWWTRQRSKDDDKNELNRQRKHILHTLIMYTIVINICIVDTCTYFIIF